MTRGLTTAGLFPTRPQVAYIIRTRIYATEANRLCIRCLGMAERVGFEPTCRLPDNTLSRRARYDHFGTSPHAQNAQVVQKQDSSSFHPGRASTKTQKSRALPFLHRAGAMRCIALRRP